MRDLRSPSASKEGKSLVISFTRQQVHDLEQEAVEGNISNFTYTS